MQNSWAKTLISKKFKNKTEILRMHNFICWNSIGNFQRLAKNCKLPALPAYLTDNSVCNHLGM